MLIINADDWGRSVAETDRALECFKARRITSVSAMVFMQDSERAAALAGENGVDVGLHLNLSQPYNDARASTGSRRAQQRIVRFLTSHKYALLFYHPGLAAQFRRAFREQLEEFIRLYGRPPSHLDGHQHLHLCTNMLLARIIPSGQKVRRNFSFLAGEKGSVNRAYRRLVDTWLTRSYRLTDYFFSLGQCLAHNRLGRVVECSRNGTVELMTHPIETPEHTWLMSTQGANVLEGLKLGSYATL